MQSFENATSKTKDAEKTGEFRPVEMDCDKGVDEIITIKNKDLPNEEHDPEEDCPVPEGVHDSLASMTKKM